MHCALAQNIPKQFNAKPLLLCFFISVKAWTILYLHAWLVQRDPHLCQHPLGPEERCERSYWPCPWSILGCDRPQGPGRAGCSWSPGSPGCQTPRLRWCSQPRWSQQSAPPRRHTEGKGRHGKRQRGGGGDRDKRKWNDVKIKHSLDTICKTQNHTELGSRLLSLITFQNLSMRF